MVDYAIFRTAKLKTSGNIMGSLAHTFRERETPNADAVRTHTHNKIIIGSDSAGGVYNTLNNRLSQLGKIRKNGVRCVELLQTFSPEAKVPLKEWIKENRKWNEATFGKDNIVSMVLHDDETTPHLVTYIVPEVNGKLNCREILGGRNKLRNLQTQYAKAMGKFGLKRGRENSKAVHEPIQKFYGDLIELQKKAEDFVKKNTKGLEQIPEPKLLETKAGYHDRVKEMIEPIKKSYDTIVANIASRDLVIKQLKKKINQQEEEIKMQEGRAEMYNAMYDELAADNPNFSEDIKVMRKLDVSAVALRLNYLEQIKPKENAIDLVKRVNDFSYKEAVAWLYNEFGAERTAGAVAEELAIKQPERPFTKIEKAIKGNIVKQLDSLGCKYYRLTLQKEENTINHGKRKDKEVFYTKDDIVNLIPYLLQRNTQEDYNISITPMDDNCFYILLDDCRLSYDELKAKGFSPCLYQKTSYNSYQAVFKVPNDIDRDAVLKLCHGLNARYGDKDMKGLRHPFRLAGFENRKPKHNRNNTFPRVELENTINVFCQKCINAAVTLFNSMTLKNNNKMNGPGI